MVECVDRREPAVLRVEAVEEARVLAAPENDRTIAPAAERDLSLDGRDDERRHRTLQTPVVVVIEVLAFAREAEWAKGGEKEPFIESARSPEMVDDGVDEDRRQLASSR